MSEKAYIAFVAPAEMAEALKELSAREDRTVSSTLRQMVRGYLSENEGEARPITKSDPSRRVEGTPISEQV